MNTIMKIGGYNIKLERRRYGHAVFSWAWTKDQAGNWLSLGEPWEAFYPPKGELLEAMEQVLGRKINVDESMLGKGDLMLDEVEILIRSFLASHEILSEGLVFYTPAEWRNGVSDAYGREDMIKAVNIKTSGLYEIVNYETRDASRLYELLEVYLRRAGYAFEPMQPWAIGIYSI